MNAFGKAKQKTKSSEKEKASAPDPKGMRCPECKEPGFLTAVMLWVLRVPLAKGGGVKLTGIKIHRGIAKDWWNTKQKVKKVVCGKCAAKFEYVEGEGLKPLDVA